MTTMRPPTLIGRLLHEISWEGNARPYREGGRGRENVLTAEVFLALDFLPRTAFLGRILQAAVGASETVQDLSLEVEQLTFHFLPGDVFLARKTPALWLQPDLRIESPHVHCFVEAKRIKRGAFQPEQLAREYLAVVQEAELCNQKPLLLLVLPASPPVRVSKHRPLDISKAIKTALASVLSRCEHEFSSVETLEKGIDSVVSYITWPAVIEAISAARDECSLGNGSVDASVKRIANAALSAIDWHS